MRYDSEFGVRKCLVQINTKLLVVSEIKSEKS